MSGENSEIEVNERLSKHFQIIYGEDKVEDCLNRLNRILQKYKLEPLAPKTQREIWSHKDVILITYGDMVQPESGEPVSMLSKQKEFLNKKLKGCISTVHILPFFPSSSDDGFSVVDYKRVDTTLGGWDDIESISKDFYLMGDLVMNHTSRYSEWFSKYLDREAPYTDYFIEVDPKRDMSSVTRPRSSPILTHVHTKEGEKFVWSTFSDDQIDVNFENPDVLFEYIDIFCFYLEKGLSVIRLDAVAFIWKKFGTSSIHLKETHEIVKLFRTIVDFYAPETTIITETNVPHLENISYFGDGDESHMVYQFSLPPLLLHAILSENAQYLTEWSRSLKRLPDNCTYFNFTASHDGIGVRPLEGLLPQTEFDQLISNIRKNGGFVSEKKNPDGTQSPYELNVTYFDAFKDEDKPVSVQEKRYICSQIIAMSVVGVPALYFHNLTASPNNVEGVAVTGRYRTTNRKKWMFTELMEKLNDSESSTHRIFKEMKKIIAKKQKHPAFHPFGRQKTHNLGPEVFCIGRWNPDETEKVLIVANVTGETVSKDLTADQIPVSEQKEYVDILSEEICVINGKVTLNPFQVIWVKIMG